MTCLLLPLLLAVECATGAAVDAINLHPVGGRSVELPTVRALAGAMDGLKDFHGLSVPEGADRRALYHSSFRTIMTYAMTLADLDAEFRRAVSKSSGSIKVDKRLNFEGFCEGSFVWGSVRSEGGWGWNGVRDQHRATMVLTQGTSHGHMVCSRRYTFSPTLLILALAVDVQMPNEKLIHVMMDYAGPQTTICQLKYWVDFH